MQRNNEVQFRSLSTENNIIWRKNSVSFHKKKDKDRQNFHTKGIEFLQELLTRNIAFLRTKMMQ